MTLSFTREFNSATPFPLDKAFRLQKHFGDTYPAIIFYVLSVPPIGHFVSFGLRDVSKDQPERHAYIRELPS